MSRESVKGVGHVEAGSSTFAKTSLDREFKRILQTESEYKFLLLSFEDLIENPEEVASVFDTIERVPKEIGKKGIRIFIKQPEAFEKFQEWKAKKTAKPQTDITTGIAKEDVTEVESLVPVQSKTYQESINIAKGEMAAQDMGVAGLSDILSEVYGRFKKKDKVAYYIPETAIAELRKKDSALADELKSKLGITAQNGMYVLNTDLDLNSLNIKIVWTDKRPTYFTTVDTADETVIYLSPKLRDQAVVDLNKNSIAKSFLHELNEIVVRKYMRSINVSEKETLLDYFERNMKGWQEKSDTAQGIFKAMYENGFDTEAVMNLALWYGVGYIKELGEEMDKNRDPHLFELIRELWNKTNDGHDLAVDALSSGYRDYAGDTKKVKELNESSFRNMVLLVNA
ncbi:hypothetical protein KKC59_03955 [bacterium]|nr:hypothetical protein [bacterium]